MSQRMSPKRVSLMMLMRRSLLHRRTRSLAALLSLTVSAAVATTLLTLYASLDQKLHKQFRAFGANIVITAPNGIALPPNTLAIVRNTAGPDSHVIPFAYVVAQTKNGAPIVVAGTDFAAIRTVDSWWQVSHWPDATTVQTSTTDEGIVPSLVGTRAQAFVSGDHFPLTYNGHALSLLATGTVHTGGPEDSRVYIPLDQFTAWTGLGATTLEVQAPGNAIQVQGVLDHLHLAIPNVEVHAVRQLVESEGRVVSRTHALMLSSLVLIALTVAICVLATLTASVLERRRDFAIMKALGSTQHQVSLLFLLEAVLLALAGAAGGYLLGSLFAFLIGEWNFSTAIAPLWQIAPQVLLLNLLVAIVAAGVPMRILRAVEPATLLRGE
ncbi:MAG TPA: FtsX-like permease family protein [Acidobacteriaceae bacterium]|jgi:putative ABC transport system permease protein|nr:FtsX-like permease family protein [Acidobacteriaceae bacterium]